MSHSPLAPILRRPGVSWGCVGIELARLISPFGSYPLFGILRKFLVQTTIFI